MFQRTSQLLLAGLLGSGVTLWTHYLLQGTSGGDFTWLYRGASFLFKGINPYTPGLNFNTGYLDTAPLFYPLPAVLLASPWIWLDVRISAACMTGLSVFVLVFLSWTRNRLILFVLISSPFLMLTRVGQMGLWLVSACIVPWLWWLAVLKPSLGLFVVAWWLPELRKQPFPYKVFAPGLLILLCLTLVSFSILPSWMGDWLTNVHAGSLFAATDRPAFYGEENFHNFSKWTEHRSPLLTLPFGPLFLLILLKWRDRRSWLFLFLVAIPQVSVFYDQVLLWLFPRTTRGAILLTILSWVAYFITRMIGAYFIHQPWISHQLGAEQLIFSWIAGHMFLYFAAMFVLLSEPTSDILCRAGKT